MRARLIGAIGSVCLALATHAQSPEALQTILDRGTVRQWLICGPFEPDIADGIRNALAAERPLLGETDHMTSLGGIRRTRPQDGLQVRSPDGATATWRLRNQIDGTLDFSTYLGSSGEAVGFAAFYAIADRPRTVLLEVQSTLGSRIIHNGVILRGVRGGGLSDLGVDRVVLQFRTGVNLVMLEVPGLEPEEIAGAIGRGADYVAHTIGRSRPELTAGSGLSVFARLYPAEEVEGIYIVPRLEATGAFTGSVDNPRKEVLVRIFNPLNRASGHVNATLERAGGGAPLRKGLTTVFPDQFSALIFEVPFGTIPVGQREGMRVRVQHRAGEVTFNTELTADPPPKAGTVHYVRRPATMEVDAYLRAFRANSLLTDSVEEFGYHLGPAWLWRWAWQRAPEHRDRLRDAVLAGRVAADPGYSSPDMRLVRGDTLLRNLQLGRQVSEALLGEWSPVYHAWNVPALSLRMPDLLHAAGATGIVDNLPYPGRAAYGLAIGPGREGIPFRHKAETAEPDSKEDLRALARRHRADLSQDGIPNDVLIGEYAGPAEAFWAVPGIGLRRSVPSVDVAGGGDRRLFESFALDLQQRSVELIDSAPALVSWRPGEVAAQSALKAAYWKTEGLLRQAETIATLHGMTGGAFPDSALDAAWRNVLWTSTPDRLGFAPTFDNFVQSLVALRRASLQARSALDNSLTGLLDTIDTYTDAPLRDEGILALVVFNSSAITRSDLVELDLPFDQFPGLSMINGAGEPVPFVAEHIVVRNSRIARARFSFVARDVPGFGHTTYYLVPSGRPAVWAPSDGTQIDSDRLSLVVDPERGGAIAEFTAPGRPRAYGDTLLNDLLAFPEDTGQNVGGRELWINGEPKKASETTADIQKFVGPGAQRLEISVPFLGGEAIRRITLYDGLDYAVCELQLRDIQENDHAIALSFPAGEGMGEAVAGTAFGGRTARVAQPDAAFQTRANEHAGSALEPFLGFFGLLPGNAVVDARGNGQPIRPIRIVLGDPAYAAVAGDLLRELVAKSIPAQIHGASRADAAGYTDSSKTPTPYDIGDHAEYLWIQFGDATDPNPPSGEDLELLEPPGEEGFVAPPEEDSLNFFLDDERPTIRIPGSTVREIEDHTRTLINALNSRDALVVADNQAPERAPFMTQGLAVLTDAGGLAAFETNRALWFVHHGSSIEGTQDQHWSEFERVDSVRYGLYPVDLNWRHSALAARAESISRPLIAWTTTLHLGEVPGTHSFINLTGGRTVASGLRPARMRAATMEQAGTHPANGVVLAIAESAGERATLTVDVGKTVFDSGTVDASGNVIRSIRAMRGLLPIELDAGEFVWAGFRPAVASPTIPPPGTPDSGHSYWARGWEHGQPVLPEGNLPIGIALRAPSEDDSSSITLVINNSKTDEPVSGEVVLESGGEWSAGTSRIPFDLPAGTHTEEQILLLRGEEGTEGYVVATVTSGTVQAVDIWPRGGVYDIDTVRRGDEIQVTLVNRSHIPLVGSVDLICPYNYWSSLGFVSRETVGPAHFSLRIEPFETRRVVFRLSNAALDPPITLEAAFNGSRKRVALPKL